ncbi:MAG: hypothetical protein LC130_24460 [Bryobacterales bacterium]|nr:hypothetical protein [Bryobacterales bacterium]
MTKARIFVCVAAVMALAVLIRRIGLSEIANQLLNLGTVLPIVLSAGILRLLLQTRAWWIALRADGVQVPQSRLVAVRLASQAAGYLTVLGPIASEPAKVVLLRASGDTARTAPATLVETGSYWFTTVVLGLAGTCAAAFLFVDVRVLWAAAILFTLMSALLVTRRSLLSPLVRLAGPRAPKWLLTAETIERGIRSFRDRQPEAAWRVLALDSIAQLVTLLEVAAVLWAADIRFSFLHVLTIEAAGRMVKIFGAWIPGRIGADESGAAVSFALLGLPPAAGLMLVVARRVRDLLWCTAGIVWAARSRVDRPDPPTGSGQISLCLEEH